MSESPTKSSLTEESDGRFPLNTLSHCLPVPGSFVDIMLRGGGLGSENGELLLPQ